MGRGAETASDSREERNSKQEPRIHQTAIEIYAKHVNGMAHDICITRWRLWCISVTLSDQIFIKLPLFLTFTATRRARFISACKLLLGSGGGGCPRYRASSDN